MSPINISSNFYKDFGVKLPAGQSLEKVQSNTLGADSRQLLGAIAKDAKNFSTPDSNFYKQNVTNGSLNAGKNLPFQIVKDAYTAVTKASTNGLTPSQVANNQNQGTDLGQLVSSMQPKQNTTSPQVPYLTVSTSTGQIQPSTTTATSPPQ